MLEKTITVYCPECGEFVEPRIMEVRGIPLGHKELKCKKGGHLVFKFRVVKAPYGKVE